MTAPGKRRSAGGPEVLDVEILVRVNRDRREAYKAAAKARGTTMADVAREALEDLVEEWGIGPALSCPRCGGALVGEIGKGPEAYRCAPCAGV